MQTSSPFDFKVALLSENATLPTRGDPDAAGYDLYSSKNVVINPGETVVVPTDIAVEFPSRAGRKYLHVYGRIAPRSGLSTKGLFVNAGVVDSSFRGPVGVVMYNSGTNPYTVSIGDRIAQFILEVYYIPTNIVRVDRSELSNTERGEGGFGSTGN